MKHKSKKPPPVVVKRKTKRPPKPEPPPVLKRKVKTMSKPKNHDDNGEPIPGPDQGEQRPYPDPLMEPPPDHDHEARRHREGHPIEAALTSIDDAMRKAQGGEEGAGIFALLSNVAAQMGVRITPPAAEPAEPAPATARPPLRY